MGQLLTERALKIRKDDDANRRSCCADAFVADCVGTPVLDLDGCRSAGAARRSNELTSRQHERHGNSAHGENPRSE
jgi:hypothetical protein